MTLRPVAPLMMMFVMVAAPTSGQSTMSAPTTTERHVDERGGVDLDAAIARALEREPAIRATRADLVVARGRLEQAGLRPNPSLTFERRDEPSGTDSLTSFGIEWPLDLFRRDGRTGSAEKEVEVTRHAVSNRERLLVADVRMQYGEAAAAVREVEVAEETASTARRLLELVRARVVEGAGTPLERDVLEVALGRIEIERVKAEGRADAAMIELKRLLGMEAGESLRLRETLETLVARRAPGGVAAGPAPTDDRPDVREATARLTLAEAQVDQARREGRVDVSLFGAYMRMDAGFPQQGFSPEGELERVRGQFNSIAFGAVVMLPLLSRNQGEVAAAVAARDGAQARREAAALAARADVAAALARDAQAQRALALYGGGLRTRARQNLDVVRQTFELGRATIFDVLQEQRRFLDLEQAYIAALREVWEARTSVTRALGETR